MKFNQVKEHPEGDELTSFIKQFGRQHRHMADTKNRSTVWFVSHCATQARREMYVKKLKRLVDVDTYGRCGKLKCPRSNETMCNERMESTYRFYLSFENSLCTDYITEKFFRTMKFNIIPVVYNGADMSVYAPPNSYIDALAFKSVSALAAYLKKVTLTFVLC